MVKEVIRSPLAEPLVDGEARRVNDSDNSIVGVTVDVEDEANVRVMMMWRVGSTEKVRRVRSRKTPVSLDDCRCGTVGWIRHG